MEKVRLLKESEIECRVSRCNQYGANILLYKNARTDMDILDEALGIENWVTDYKEIKGNLFCGIGIREKADQPFIWKWDCGIESRQDGEGNEKKGEASDAFKRAGFKVGIGRELYTAPDIFIPAEKLNMKASDFTDARGRKQQKFATYDTFMVEKIAYDENRRIRAIAIRNEKTGKRCYVWQSDSEK